MKQGQSLDLARLCADLQALGWDAVQGQGEVAARLEQPPRPGIWLLVVDRDGRCRFTATRELEAPVAATLNYADRRYRLLVEKQVILTIQTKLNSEAELGGVLRDFAQLAMQRML